MERRDLDLPDLDAVVREARRLNEVGYRKAGQWDLAQACEHSTMPMNQSIDGFVFNAPLPVRLIATLFMKKSFFAKRHIKAGLKAPAPMVPEPGHDPAAAIQAMHDAADRVKNHRGEFKPHPVFGRLTHQQWQDFLTIHAMHHLSFLLPNE